MRLFSALFLATLFVACSRSPATAPIAPGASAAVSGVVLERLDGAPYSYLRIETDKGDVWAAVPMGNIGKGDMVSISHGASLKNFEAKPIHRTFDTVVFGAVELRK